MHPYAIFAFAEGTVVGLAERLLENCHCSVGVLYIISTEADASLMFLLGRLTLSKLNGAYRHELSKMELLAGFLCKLQQLLFLND